jgi:hypothetical protein
MRDAIAIAILVALSASYLLAARARIARVVADPKSAHELTASDSQHYLGIAGDLSRGDFSFSQVRSEGGRDRAHRQPLYPALLAIVLALRGRDLAALAMLNAWLTVAAMWVAFAIGTLVFHSRAAGVAGAAVLWRVPYLWDNATTRLLTEPGYVVVSLLLALAFLRYLATGRRAWLYAAAAAGALCYLQRVNGLVTALVALVALRVLDVTIRLRPGGRGEAAARRAGLVRRHLIAGAVFVAATIPSWLPRLVYTGNPLYHGYLSNYLWVDDHARAHVPGPPRFGWRDYVREHDLGDAVARMGNGLRRTLWNAPREKYGDVVFVAMLAGVVAAVAARDRKTLAWIAVGLVQMLPLAWIALANPVRRIPATALLAFAVVAVASGTAIALRALLARRRHARTPAPAA